jgi:hypothetical protein
MPETICFDNSAHSSFFESVGQSLGIPFDRDEAFLVGDFGRQVGEEEVLGFWVGDRGGKSKEGEEGCDEDGSELHVGCYVLNKAVNQIYLNGWEK